MGRANLGDCSVSQQPLPVLPDFDRCRRCGQQPEIRYWDHPATAKYPREVGMNVSCACRTISGDREGMAETWNWAASRLREDE